MKKLLLILLCVPLIFSCGDKENDNAESSAKNAENQLEKTVTLKMIEDGYTGEGNIKWVSGASYVGEWKNGKKHGKGTYKWVSGSEYVGEWKDDINHGEGTHTYANGDKYVGEYKYGKRNGLGIMNFRDGNQYIGEFKDGQMNGQGALTFANGIIEEGIWENNIFLGKNKDCKTPRIFGDLTICLPDIKGMIECYSDPSFKSYVDKVAFANPGQKPIAAYVSELIININKGNSQNINKYEGFEDRPWINVYSFKQIQSQNVTQDDMKDLVSSISESLLDYTDADITDVNKKMINAQLDNLLADKPIMLERYTVNSQIESVIMLTRYDNGDQGIYKLSIMNYLLIENRLICYTYIDNYKGPKTIDNLRMRNDYFGLSMIQENK